MHKCFAHFRGKREPHPCLPVAKVNPRKESISVWCSGSASIHTADALRYRHPAFVLQRHDIAYELSQRFGGYHDAGGQTLRAGDATILQCGY